MLFKKKITGFEPTVIAPGDDPSTIKQPGLEFEGADNQPPVQEDLPDKSDKPEKHGKHDKHKETEEHDKQVEDQHIVDEVKSAPAEQQQDTQKVPEQIPEATPDTKDKQVQPAEKVEPHPTDSKPENVAPTNPEKTAQNTVAATPPTTEPTATKEPAQGSVGETKKQGFFSRLFKGSTTTEQPFATSPMHAGSAPKSSSVSTQAAPSAVRKLQPKDKLSEQPMVEPEPELKESTIKEPGPDKPPVVIDATMPESSRKAGAPIARPVPSGISRATSMDISKPKPPARIESAPQPTPQEPIQSKPEIREVKAAKTVQPEQRSMDSIIKPTVGVVKAPQRAEEIVDNLMGASKPKKSKAKNAQIKERKNKAKSYSYSEIAKRRERKRAILVRIFWFMVIVSLIAAAVYFLPKLREEYLYTSATDSEIFYSAVEDYMASSGVVVQTEAYLPFGVVTAVAETNGRLATGLMSSSKLSADINQAQVGYSVALDVLESPEGLFVNPTKIIELRSDSGTVQQVASGVASNIWLEYSQVESLDQDPLIKSLQLAGVVGAAAFDVMPRAASDNLSGDIQLLKDLKVFSGIRCTEGEQADLSVCQAELSNEGLLGYYRKSGLLHEAQENEINYKFADSVTVTVNGREKQLKSWTFTSNKYGLEVSKSLVSRSSAAVVNAPIGALAAADYYNQIRTLR